MNPAALGRRELKAKPQSENPLKLTSLYDYTPRSQYIHRIALSYYCSPFNIPEITLHHTHTNSSTMCSHKSATYRPYMACRNYPACPISPHIATPHLHTNIAFLEFVSRQHDNSARRGGLEGRTKFSAKVLIIFTVSGALLRSHRVGRRVDSRQSAVRVVAYAAVGLVGAWSLGLRCGCWRLDAFYRFC
jgi:hypothetical protein